MNTRLAHCRTDAGRVNNYIRPQHSHFDLHDPHEQHRLSALEAFAQADAPSNYLDVAFCEKADKYDPEPVVAKPGESEHSQVTLQLPLSYEWRTSTDEDLRRKFFKKRHKFYKKDVHVCGRKKQRLKDEKRRVALTKWSERNRENLDYLIETSTNPEESAIFAEVNVAFVKVEEAVLEEDLEEIEEAYKEYQDIVKNIIPPSFAGLVVFFSYL